MKLAGAERFEQPTSSGKRHGVGGVGLSFLTSVALVLGGFFFVFSGWPGSGAGGACFEVLSASRWARCVASMLSIEFTRSDRSRSLWLAGGASPVLALEFAVGVSANFA